MIQQRDQNWWYKLNGLARYGVVYGATNAFASPIVLTEYPKSGGTWLSQMMGYALGIPYPRNRLPHMGSQIIHGCYLNVNRNIDTVVTYRDGRDTLVSYYYHVMIDKPITSAKFNAKLRKALSVNDPMDITAIMPRFIEWTFTGGYPGYSWKDFWHKWRDVEGPIFTSYEKVTADPHGELKRILQHFNKDVSQARIDETVAKFSFEAQAGGRKPGEEDVHSFVRKGIIGDWKNVFNQEACEIFDHFAGKELIELGYEESSDWINVAR